MKILITVEVPDGAAVAVSTSETTATAPSTAAPATKRGAKAAAVATPSAPLAAPQAAAAAMAPAAAAPAAEAPTLKAVNDVVSKLAGLDRDVAVKILVAHGANTNKTSTSQLKPDVYQIVIDETEEAVAKIEAALAQTANTGSLV